MQQNLLFGNIYYAGATLIMGRHLTGNIYYTVASFIILQKDHNAQLLCGGITYYAVASFIKRQHLL